MKDPKQTELPFQDAGHRPGPLYPWESLSDEELLKVRICDLKIRIPGSPVEPLIDRFYEELDARGVRYHPPCYLTTEWLTPDKVPIIGIPFCLAHPRLKHLEKAMMLGVEGGTDKTCMKLLRHEAGHVFNYAYRFYRRSRWRELFGPFSAEYDVQDYYPRPYSRQYVVHLEDNYAQAHPDEDFAETFAVWMTPGLDWRKKYREWGALRKLEYVDTLMQKAGPAPPPVTSRARIWPLSQVRSTLESYYRRKRVQFAEGYPGYYDPDLRRIFVAQPAGEAVKASVFLSRHRRGLTRTVSQWARVPKYTVDNLIRRLTRRTRKLELYTPADEAESLMSVSVYLTSLACQHRQGNEEQINRKATG